MATARYLGQPYEYCIHVAAGVSKYCDLAHAGKCEAQRVNMFQPNARIAADLQRICSGVTSMHGFQVGVSWSQQFQRLVLWEMFEWQGRLTDMIDAALPSGWIKDPENWIYQTGRELLKAAEFCGAVSPDGRQAEIKWSLTNEDGSPRDVSRWDIQSWLDIRHGHGENPIPKMKEHNKLLDKFWKGQVDDREGDIQKRFESKRGDGRAGGGIVGGGARPSAGRDSRQYICPHRKRNVNCVVCRPKKKIAFMGGQKSGKGSTGYQSVDMRDHFDADDLVEAEG